MPYLGSRKKSSREAAERQPPGSFLFGFRKGFLTFKIRSEAKSGARVKRKTLVPNEPASLLYGAGNGNRTNKPRSNAVKRQILSSCQRYFYRESCIILRTIQECWKQLCVKKCVTNQPFPSSLRKAALTACAVFSASPVRAWEYWPNVSMFWLWPTSSLISPSGSVLTTLTKVCRNS